VKLARKTKAKQEQPPEEAPPAEATETAEDIKAKTDALLDEIEGVLETNAEQFVHDFVQKSGE
jgi:ubiquitin-like protein Pup